MFVIGYCSLYDVAYSMLFMVGRWSSLVVGCCWLVVVCGWLLLVCSVSVCVCGSSLLVVCCLEFVVRGLLFVGCCFVDCCWLTAVLRRLFFCFVFVIWMLFVV